jgi:hypothetical protein
MLFQEFLTVIDVTVTFHAYLLQSIIMPPKFFWSVQLCCVFMLFQEFLSGIDGMVMMIIFLQSEEIVIY